MYPQTEEGERDRVYHAAFRRLLDDPVVYYADLPEDQRRCWTLRELAECSYGQIAEELDLPVSTVRGLLARARKTLLREMEEWR